MGFASGWRLSLLAVALWTMCLTGALGEDAAAPAVDGFNSKFSAEGGLLNNDGAGLFRGSFTLPLGHSFGLQADGALGVIDDKVLGGGGLHLFSRDPSSHLLGLYGSFHTWDSTDIFRVAAEVALYEGPFTLEGIAGFESVNVPRLKGGLPVLTRNTEDFFTDARAAFYPDENLKLSAGLIYANKDALGQAELEWMPRWNGAPVSLTVNSVFGRKDATRITAGVRVYLGVDQMKSLIRRHREDDPVPYTPIPPKLNTGTAGQSGQQCVQPGGSCTLGADVSDCCAGSTCIKVGEADISGQGTCVGDVDLD